MSRSRSIAWVVWIIASMFYAYQYILRVMPSIMLEDIMQQFNIDAAVFGQFSGVYYIGYSLMHLPIGILLDRYGPKPVMTACILLTVTGLLPIIFADYWVYPIVGRALIGMGSSAAILGAFKVIRMAFSEERFTRMLSLSVTIGLIGAIYGGGPVSYMCDILGYKMVVQIFVGIGMALAALTYFIVPEMAPSSHRSAIADLKEVFTNGKVIALCIFAGMMVGPLEGFADVWGSEFLKQVYGFDTAMASYLPSMIFIGMCFGAPVLSLIAEKTGSYLGSIIGAGVIMALSFVALILGYFTVNSMIVSFLIVGICCAYQILAIYKASTYVPEHVSGLTTAVANMIIMSFGYAFHTVIGVVVNAYGGPDVAQAFVYGIGVIPITLAIGVIGFCTLLYQAQIHLRKVNVS
ncbi:MAG: MFS transporter [Alphaproteobacteria bacterium 41-28]|mgnify:CR=1 FL=1|nr:MAG: MFS transporter [Alphaproteobacteria bacterium 41-28]